MNGREGKGREGFEPNLAPEVFEGKYDEKADVWSYGITCIEFCQGEAPYQRLARMGSVIPPYPFTLPPFPLPPFPLYGFFGRLLGGKINWHCGGNSILPLQLVSDIPI